MGHSANTPITMDARKFIKHINNGAGAKLKFFEETIQRFGKESGRQFRLASLDTNSLMFEDTDKKLYYLADIKKVQNGRVAIENIRQINIVEAEKAEQFGKNVAELVESISKNDYRDADRTFNRIESQRYRSRVIPESGMITTRDGVAHNVRTNNKTIKENHIPVLIKMFCESVQDSVELDKGMVVRGVFNETQEKFVIPINEYTRRRLVARTMRGLAEGAYKSKGFQDLVYGIATLVCERKINEAVRAAAKFLTEEQEFCMLDQHGMTKLVEGALAARCEFNGILAADTGALMYKVNTKVNRDSILEAWSKTAQKAENASLLANVKVLEESKEFHKDYNEFLNVIFTEGADVSQARARAYLASLKIIASVLPNLEDEDGDKMSSVEELNSLIAKLERPEPDTSSILQAEELLTGISDSLLDRISTLESFDKMPSSEEDAEVEGEEESKTPVPLPEIESKDEEGEMPPAETPAPGQAPGAPPQGLPEGAEAGEAIIEAMSQNQLKEELEAWKLEGETYLKEDGFEDCHKQFDRYIGRCLTLGPAAQELREQFEQMRDIIVETGNEATIDEDDKYARSVKIAFESVTGGAVRGQAEGGSPIPPRGKSAIMQDTKHTVDPKLEAGLPTKGAVGEGKIDRSYHTTLHEELAGAEPRLRMGDKIQDSGKSVADKKAAQAADGRKGDGAKAAQDYSGPAGSMKSANGLRMDDLQGQGSVQTGPVHAADGRKGDGAKAAKEYGMEHKTITGPGSSPAELRMDELQTGTSVMPKSVDSSDGRVGGRTAGGKSKFMPVESVGAVSNPQQVVDGHTAENYKVGSGAMSKDVGLNMNKELQAKGGGVQKAGVAATGGRDGTGAKAASGDRRVAKGLGDAPKSETNMAAEFQGRKSVQPPGVKAADGRKGDGAETAESPVKGKGLGEPKGGSTSMDEFQKDSDTVAESEDPFSIERIASLIEEELALPDPAMGGEEEVPAEEGMEGEELGDVEDEAAADMPGEEEIGMGDLPGEEGLPGAGESAESTPLDAAKMAAASATATAVAANAAVAALEKEAGAGEELPGEEGLGEEAPMDIDSEASPESALPPEAPVEEEMPAEEAPEEIEESQRKGPTTTIKPRGFKRASLAPAKEGKDKNGKPINEDLAAFYTKDSGQEVDDIISSIVTAMNQSGNEGEGMEGGMGLGDEMPGDEMGGMGEEMPGGPMPGDEAPGLEDLPPPAGEEAGEPSIGEEPMGEEPAEGEAEEGGEEAPFDDTLAPGPAPHTPEVDEAAEPSHTPEEPSAGGAPHTPKAKPAKPQAKKTPEPKPAKSPSKKSDKKDD